METVQLQFPAGRISSILCVCAVGWLALSAAAEPVTLFYENRAPFMVVQNGELVGTEGKTAADTFKAAGVAFTLSEAPGARQIEMVGKNLSPSCAIGLYWTAERARVGKYTLPIYRSQSQDLVMRTDNPKFQSIDSMRFLLADPEVSLALRNGYSYGSNMDALLSHAKARLKRPPEDSRGRIKMVLEGMADGALFTHDEAAYQIGQFGADGKVLAIRHFSDTPPGVPSYLYCSNSVDDELIGRLNKVLKKRH